MSDLMDFLRARLDEDDAADEILWPCDCGWPERLARAVEAKRRMLDLEQGWPYGSGDPEGAEHGWSDAMDRVLRLLALPYADHPDYREEWRP